MSIPQGHFDVLKVQIASFRESLGSRSIQENKRQFNELSREYARLKAELSPVQKIVASFDEVQVLLREFWELKEEIANPQPLKRRCQPLSFTEVDKGLALTSIGGAVLSYGLPTAYASVAWPVSLAALTLLGAKKVYDSCCSRPAKVKDESPTVSGSSTMHSSHPSLRYRGSGKGSVDVDYKGMSREELERLSRQQEYLLSRTFHSELRSYGAGFTQFNIPTLGNIGNPACAAIATLALAKQFRGEMTSGEDVGDAVTAGAVFYQRIMHVLMNDERYAAFRPALDAHLPMDALWRVLKDNRNGALAEFKWVYDALAPEVNLSGHLAIPGDDLRAGHEAEQIAACVNGLICPSGGTVGGILTVGRETYFVLVTRSVDGSRKTVDFFNSHGEGAYGAAKLHFTSVQRFANFMANKRHAIPERDLKLLASKGCSSALDANQFGILQVGRR